MFIKEAYEKRIKKEDSENTDVVQSKRGKTQLIGSIKNEKINYDREEQFFSKQDVPLKARQVKNEVKEFIDPDHLGLRKKEWNTSVSVPKNMQLEQSHERKLIKIKLGLFDHPVPKPSSPKIYEGCDTRNDYTNWNVSTEVSKKQIVDSLATKTLLALKNRKSLEKSLVKDYVDPMTKTAGYNQKLRDQKVAQADFRNSIREEFKFQNPTASAEKTDAAVFRLAYQKKLVGSIKPQSENLSPFKATLTQTLKSRIGLKYHHTGIYQKITLKKKDEVEEMYSWSCCMNEDEKSPGCVMTVDDRNRWNLASFNNN